ncbi:DNA-binding helix-turn-helix protein [Leptospira yanagawae serovar Saopaulo str. Sao Paulo = ATCC 700523]|uniref:DNA-binding helix-turn-helix protein n=2 Tax=Leptospira yanagawae TaxID=293069 RepID=A0A5E8H910_9LEPT|nr:DNA-binding helix-turn-helix protein [Leptospira yanagawae serovar Saopaulo str. Sao Paulo = ATCC 700523]
MGLEKEPKMKTNRKGIWIPVWIENLNLSHSQTKLFAEIVSLHDNGGCFASNRYFSEILGLKADTISRLITSLKKLGILEQTGFDGRRRFLKPILQFQQQDSEKNPILTADTNRKNLQTTTENNSKPALDYCYAPSSTVQIKNTVHKITSFEEFKIWSERTLSHSTHSKISHLTSPDSMEESLQKIWNQWMEKTKLKSNRFQVGIV